MSRNQYQMGDPVVYQVDKFTMHPGPRAKEVHPASRGDYYNYSVDKFWRVAGLLENGQLKLVARRGKEHIADSDDPHLRKARFWERVLYGKRFPRLKDG